MKCGRRFRILSSPLPSSGLSRKTTPGQKSESGKRGDRDRVRLRSVKRFLIGQAKLVCQNPRLGMDERLNVHTQSADSSASATTALGRAGTHTHRVHPLRGDSSSFATRTPPLRGFRLLFQQTPDVLRKVIPYLHDAEMRQFENSTLAPSWIGAGP
jgi:hypothetical protein